MKSKLKKKRAGRKRRAAGWTLLALGLLVAAVWVRSGWQSFGTQMGPIQVFAYPSDVTVRIGSADERRRYFQWNKMLVLATFGPIRTAGEERWTWAFGKSDELPFKLFIFTVPFWPFPLLLWTTGGLALWSGRRARRRAVNGLCKKCGYSLAGLSAGSTCPECGKGAGTK